MSRIAPPPEPTYKHDKREGMSEKHLKCIRQLPCCVSGETQGTEAHHLMQTGERGMGMKSPDKYAVPLNWRRHTGGVHANGSKNETEWFAEQGIDALALAACLWATTGDLELMEGIVILFHAQRERT